MPRSRPGDDWLARLDAVWNSPVSDEARWAQLRALVAEAEAAQWSRSYLAPNYDHLPSLEELKLHIDQPAVPPDDPELERAWEAASQRLRKICGLLGAKGGTLTVLPADSRDTYLVTRNVLDSTDSDRFRYAARNLEALRRAEKFPRGLRTKRVTPGHIWTIVRLDEAGFREAVKITLTINAGGAGQLRCGDRITPATAPEWAELMSQELPPMKVHHKREVLRPLGALFRLLISEDFWVGALLLALAVTIGVIIVMALS
jgi:hypothetical protein